MPAQLLSQNPGPGQGPDPNIHPGNEQAFAELKTIREENAVLAQQLQQFQIGLDPFSVIQTRLSAVIEVLVPSKTVAGQATQIAIEVQFETMMRAILAEARRNAVTAQLQAGAHVPPEMLEAMHRAQGGKPVAGPGVPPGFRNG